MISRFFSILSPALSSALFLASSLVYASIPSTQVIQIPADAKNITISYSTPSSPQARVEQHIYFDPRELGSTSALTLNISPQNSDDCYYNIVTGNWDDCRKDLVEAPLNLE